MKIKHTLLSQKKLILYGLALLMALTALFIFIRRSQASPSVIVDTTTSLAISQPSQRRIIRTTNGTGGNRVFSVVANGTELVLYYSDDADASSPTWNSVTVNASTTYNVADMVWDETNNVIYMCYAARSLSNSSNRDVKYTRISTLGSTPTVGAQQTALDGTLGGTTYTMCNIEIAGDSGTNSVFVFGNAGTAGADVNAVNVVTGTLNSDTPTWSSPYTVKSWAASGPSGSYGITRMNTDKLVMFYYNGTDLMATRHNDADSALATSGWDALDGTDNSATTISADDPSINFPAGSIVGDFDTDTAWFSWIDAGSDINTQSWQAGAVGTEYMVEATGTTSPGYGLTTDGVLVYLVYRNTGDTTTQVFRSRPINDGVTAWSSTESLLLDIPGENLQYSTVAKKLYQGKIDAMSISSTSDIVLHSSSYRIAGFAYQESVSSTYEGTTVWSECDGATLNVSLSLAGSAKYSTWCDATTGAFSFVLPQPTTTDADITIFYDEDSSLATGLIAHWKLDEASWNGTPNEVIDSSPNLLHGARVGDANTSSTAKLGRAGTFDGNGDYVNFGDQAAHDLTLPLTASAWIYLTALPSVKGTDSEIVSKYAAAPNRQWTFAIGTDDTLYFWKSHNGTNGQYAFPTGYVFDAGDLNTWIHVAVTASQNGTAKLYVNGSLVDTGTFTDLTVYTAGTPSTYIGARSTGANYFQGNIDDVRLYSRDLSGNEIAFMANDYDPLIGSNIKAAVFTHNADVTTDITGIPLYKDRSIIRSESGTAITNADINSYDQSSDLDIPLASTGTNVVADLGTKILINSGDTYAPGGNVTTPKLHIKGTYTGGSETLIIYGGGTSATCDSALSSLRPLCIDSGTFTPNSNNTLFSASSNALIQNATYNILNLNPGANSVTHTLMAGTFTINGALSMGNGVNSSVDINANTNSTTLTLNSSLTINTNTSFIANGSNTMTVAGNWTNSGSFTHSSGTVILNGADSSTQVITGNTTFNHLTASTASNTAGRTIQYAGGSTTTVAGTWTMTGASGKILTLASTNTSNWTISPSANSLDYLNVSRSTNTVGTLCAPHSSDSGFNSGWNISAGASCGSPVGFTMQTGYYVGTGTDDFSITGLGFQPNLVLIKDDASNGVDGVNFKTSVMAGETSISLGDSDGEDASNVIQSLDSDGFTVGTNADVNTTNMRYTWMAFGGSDCTSTGTFCVGNYTGNGTTQTITAVGFEPDLISIKRSGASSSIFRTGDMPTDHSQRWDNGSPITNGSGIATLHSSGFTLGNSASANAGGDNYYYFAFKSHAGIFETGTFTGDGLDDRSITVSFDPDLAMIKNGTGAVLQMAYYNLTESNGDYSSGFGDASNATGVIKSLGTGAFTVGTNIAANESGQTIYWMAFGGAAAHSPSGSFTMDVGSYTGNGTSQTINVGFQPDLVMIKDAAAAQYAVYRTSLVKGNLTLYLSSSNVGFADGITSLTSTGFTIGANAQVNTNASTFHYQAFGNAFNPETAQGAANFTIGVYRGNLLDNRDILRQPFQPDLVMLRRSGGFRAAFRTSSMVGDLSGFLSNDAEATDNIQAFNSDGFEVGVNTRVNDSDENYYFFAFKAGPYFKVGNYTGTGSAQNITSPGIQPNLVWVNQTGAIDGAFRPSDLVGNSTLIFRNTAVTSDRITALLSNGFSVGGNQAETNTSGTTYRYMVWSVPPPDDTFFLEGVNLNGINFN